ncbi:MAG TPA: hypothetical protein VN685_12645 [Rhizomicrobium sp.]|nr:hypothetical protein [Rhizomicrobium sp.]
MLEASGVGAFVLAAAGWQVRSAILRRRARRRPMAAVVSDAIIIGSNSPRAIERPTGGDATRPHVTRRIKPVVSELEKLSETGDQWGFSLRDADRAIVTFVFPGRDKAAAALKAMRRAARDLTLMELPAAGENEMLRIRPPRSKASAPDC